LTLELVNPAKVNLSRKQDNVRAPRIGGQTRGRDARVRVQAAPDYT
jgi:hypothetical protein